MIVGGGAERRVRRINSWSCAKTAATCVCRRRPACRLRFPINSLQKYNCRFIMRVHNINNNEYYHNGNNNNYDDRRCSREASPSPCKSSSFDPVLARRPEMLIRSLKPITPASYIRSVRTRTHTHTNHGIIITKTARCL